MDFSKAPNLGYCASQNTHYYGYKLHALCGLSGVIHAYDLTKAGVHDMKYLQDVKSNIIIVVSLETEDILENKFNWTYLKLPILSRSVHIG